jgi:hypothetical protein
MNSKRHDERESDLPVNLAKPARRALVEAGYWRLEQLRRALSTNGLSFADEKERTS